MNPPTTRQFAFLFLGCWLPAILAMAFIFKASTTPISLPKYYPGQDKFMHLLAYSFLSFLLAHAWERTLPLVLGGKAMVIAVVVTIAFGIVIEVCQIFCNRCFEIADILANSLGALSGSLIYWYIYRRLARHYLQQE